MVVHWSPTNRRPRMASIAASLERIKGNPLNILDRKTVERVCRERGHEGRDRELFPAPPSSVFYRLAGTLLNAITITWPLAAPASRIYAQAVASCWLATN